MIGVEEVRELMQSQDEDVFPWVISESIGGDDAKVDVDGFVHCFRDMRLHSGFTADEREEFQVVFEKFDQDGSGCVSTEELRNVLRYMGFYPSEEMLVALVKRADTDGSGEIDADEFLVVMREYTDLATKQMKGVFDTFDTDGSGQMDTEEVFECIAQLGFLAQKDSVLEAIEHVDRYKTGEITFDEFFKLLAYL